MSAVCIRKRSHSIQREHILYRREHILNRPGVVTSAVCCAHGVHVPVSLESCRLSHLPQYTNESRSGTTCVCVCVCVCARARARVRAKDTDCAGGRLKIRDR